ncbi:hypothetical protein A9K55_005118 [Cordyceps militaris]|uniref:Inheritance of peroxisomes protein 1 n=1 Tax=Cordyceps militaris TaxID=73501 RepID=A0A2H4SNV9_CORMI|nr:hypothetical protein A9K55_005118 [Cordyceps militaris]
MEPCSQPRLLQRRVATAPMLLQPLHRTPHSGEKCDGDNHALFHHADAKVISLVALSDQTFSLVSSNRDPIGPWQSHFERTIAIGSLKLYRAPGSVAFLSCGNALQPMFPKSQCWCMEEDGSKFILQIRPPSYWRIELASPQAPGSSLRDCLESVLLLDKTPCPFKESVPILLLPPDSPPAKQRRPWKPLRSYPSEPILARELGNPSGESHLLLQGGLARDAMPEHQGHHSKETVQRDDQGHRSFTLIEGSAITAENMSYTAEDETSPGGMSLENLSRTTHQQSCTEVTSSLAKSHSSSESIVLANGSEYCTDMGPWFKNELMQEKDARRYTIASSGHDAELEGLIQRARGSMQSQELLSRWDIITAGKTLAEVEVVLGKNVSTSGATPYGTSQQAPRLRLGRKELLRASSTEATSGSAQAGLLPKAIFILLRTILQVVIVGLLRITGTAAVNWWKPNSPTGGAQRRYGYQPSNGSVALHIPDQDATMNPDAWNGQ